MFNVLRAITNCNPHDVSEDAQNTWPSSDDSYLLGVLNSQSTDGELTSGTIEFAVGEHPTAAQQAWLDAHPNIGLCSLIDVED